MTWSLVFSLDASSADDKTAIYAGYLFHVLQEVGLEFSVVSNKAFNDFFYRLTIYLYLDIHNYYKRTSHYCCLNRQKQCKKKLKIENMTVVQNTAGKMSLNILVYMYSWTIPQYCCTQHQHCSLFFLQSIFEKTLL